jgi:3'-phosphoadenosine 5'-phosphosulfate sulfotransferase (PAPS reductase)/FAD synthetase
MDDRPIIWSYGGGVQSVGMLALIAAGRLPKPERVIMADTSRESSLTWLYTHRYVRPMMDTLGLCLEIAPHSLAKHDLYSSNGDLLLPAYTAKGKMPTFCSNEWKKRVVRRYLRDSGYGPERPVKMWFGISYDEYTRARVSDVDWLSNVFPLLDLEITRQDLESQITGFGLPVPPKSACWCCPNRRNAEWRQQALYAYNDHRRAVVLDTMIRMKDPEHSVYLYSNGKPLDKVNFHLPDTREVELCSIECWT